jgi:hypothetical protein
VARTKGGSANTNLTIINDTVIRSLIKIVDDLRRLDVHDENGVITYREDIPMPAHSGAIHHV